MFTHPSHTCVVLKWGTHEVDASFQMSASILDAIRLLAVMLPPARTREARHCARHLRLSGDLIARLLLRMACLDAYLGANLWLPC